MIRQAEPPDLYIGCSRKDVYRKLRNVHVNVLILQKITYGSTTDDWKGHFGLITHINGAILV